MSRYKLRTSYTLEELQEAVSQSYSRAETLRKLGLKPAGGNYSTLKKLIIDYNLDISHFTGQGWNTGDHYRPVQPAKPIEYFLTKGSNHNTSHLKKRLIKENLLEEKCSCCNGTTWLDQPIPLELDHIDGDRFNNLLDNLRLLCPNCHALTPTYRGKNQVLRVSSDSN
jgi:hypothetical protein